MSGAAFILAINLTVASLFALSFLLIAVYDKAYRSARWLALGYVFGMGTFAFEFIVPALPSTRLPVTLAYACFAAALVAFTIGLARKYDVQPPLRLLGAAFVVAIAVNLAIQDMPRDSLVRMMLYQGPYAVLQAFSVWVLLRARSRVWIDNVLVGLLVASSLHFLSKPFIAASFGGMGANPQAYLDTTYALFSQSMGTVFAIAVALMMLAIYVRQMLIDATLRAETDTLSGLFNRRGFEIRLDRLVERGTQGQMPMSLVVCDLDNFKKVNDTFGHAAGDHVIVAFSRILREAAAPHHVVSRIGGEEYAIVLPGANLAAARLYAETVRAAFSATSIEAMSADRHLSASFGVAELAAGETPVALLRRADDALYAAKDAGRDRVCVARPAGSGGRGSSAQATGERLASCDQSVIGQLLG